MIFQVPANFEFTETMSHCDNLSICIPRMNPQAARAAAALQGTFSVRSQEMTSRERQGLSQDVKPGSIAVLPSSWMFSRGKKLETCCGQGVLRRV